MTRLVADASAIVDLLAGGAAAASVRAVLAQVPEVDVPEHFHVEAVSALRGLALRGDLDPERAVRAVDLLAELRVVRHAVLPLVGEIWRRRDVLGAYDAAYLAVARSLGARLLTTDRVLATAARAEGLVVESG